MSVPICPHCGNPGELVTGENLYPKRKDLWCRKFWLCRPCDAYVGCHKKTSAPLGTLANAELRMERGLAHSAFDPLWKGGEMERNEAYAWLCDQLGIDKKYCHIAMFDTETCRKVVWIINNSIPGKRKAG